MSVQSEIGLWTDRDVDLKAATRAAGKFFGSTEFYDIRRSQGVHRPWAEVLHDLQKGAGHQLPSVYREKVPFSKSQRLENEVTRVAKTLPMEEFLDLIDGRRLVFGYIQTEQWQLLEREIRDAIPEEELGGFCPNSPLVYAGSTDLFDTLADRGFLARPRWSLMFFGHGTPPNPSDYARKFFALPHVQAARAAIEPMTGPLQEVYRPL